MCGWLKNFKWHVQAYDNSFQIFLRVKKIDIKKIKTDYPKQNLFKDCFKYKIRLVWCIPFYDINVFLPHFKYSIPAIPAGNIQYLLYLLKIFNTSCTVKFTLIFLQYTFIIRLSIVIQERKNTTNFYCLGNFHKKTSPTN